MALTRQLTVLRSLFRTLHPQLAQARKLRTSLQTSLCSAAARLPWATASHPANATQTSRLQMPIQDDGDILAGHTQPRFASRLPRTYTDEHLVVELENVTRYARPALPFRVRRQYGRAALLGLLDEARLRIQVLETELELQRSATDSVPMLTDEWPLADAPRDALSGEELPVAEGPRNDSATHTTLTTAQVKAAGLFGQHA